MNLFEILRNGLLCVILTALTWPTFASGDGSSPDVGLPTFTESTSVSWVLVPVSVQTEVRLKSAPKLEKDDFRLRIDDRPVHIESFEASHESPRTLLLFQDLSGSMANGGKLELSRQIVERLLELAEPRDEVALTTFASGRIWVDVPVTREQEAVREHMAAWQGYGTTALHDAVSWIPELRLISRRVPAVVLITDGIDNASVISPEKAREMASSAEIPVFVIALGRPKDRPDPRDRPWRYGDLLRRLAESTGGRFLEVQSADHVDRAASIIDQALENRYVLSFLAAETGDERQRSIRVTLPGRRLPLRFRAGYTGRPPQGLPAYP